MHTVTLHIEDRIFDKVINFLKNLPKNEVKIVENSTLEDWSHLELEIDKGLNSGVSNRSHGEIANNIKQKYAQY